MKQYPYPFIHMPQAMPFTRCKQHGGLDVRRDLLRNALRVCVFLCAAFVICISAVSGVAAPRAYAADAATDYASWDAVVSSISRDLDSAEASYGSGDTTTAAASSQRAYNTGYVATNMTSAVQQVQGSAEAQSQAGDFMAVTSLTYQQSSAQNIQDLKTRIQQLKNRLKASAQVLDADTFLGSPRVYGEKLDNKIRQERRKLDAESVNRNEGRGNRTWTAVAREMNAILDKAYTTAVDGHNGEKAAELVNDAYYKYYEKLGFEKTVMSAISGARVSAVEYQFKQTRKDMVAGKPAQTIKKDVTALKDMLTKDAGILDAANSGGSSAAHINPFTQFFSSSFGQAFIILIREGLEAILVVAAVIAYLVKAGYKDKLRYIYMGVLAGIIASGIMAVILNVLFGASGSHQEMIEGFTALVAMLMLLFTSNWMLNKSSVAGWNTYIRSKTEKSISTGSVLSLASLSFLAVFREGAETVLFYQALAGMVSGSDYSALYGGAAAAAVILVIVFLLIRFTSVRIPIRPFFAATSTLMAAMVVIFAGSGLHELIEADVIDGVYHPDWITNDFLGIYPYTETVVFQIIMAATVIILAAVSIISQRKARKASLQAEGDGTGASGPDTGSPHADVPHTGQQTNNPNSTHNHND